MSATAATAPVLLRPLSPEDAQGASRVVFEAFAGIHDRHGFPRDFPTLEAAAGLVGAFSAHPAIWGVGAERDGELVGSNFLDERGPIRGVGPITVDPAAQESGIGRSLMEAVLERGRDARGIRLLQDAFNLRSLALYVSLGFEVREPVAVIGGRPQREVAVGAEVRPMREDDLEACERLTLRVHGHERTGELRDALEAPMLTPVVAEREGRIVAYAAGVTFFPASFGAAETESDLLDLVLGALAATDAPASLLVPPRQGALLRGLLAAGLRLTKPMTYMTTGEYQEPQGAWFPSVLY